MRHQFRRAVRGALVIATAAVGGCGGARLGTTSRSVIVSRGDAICRRLYDRVLVAGEGITAKGGDVVYYQRILPLLRAEIAQLTALGTPDEEVATFQRPLAADRRIRRDVRDEVAFHSAATEFGFKVCSSED